MRERAVSRFGKVLRRLAKEAYGSIDGFAKAAGYERSWIYQLTWQGYAHEIRREVVLGLIKHFPEPQQRKDLLSAWRDEIAPTDLAGEIADVRTGEGIEQFLAEAGELIGLGEAVPVGKLARKACLHWRAEPGGAHYALRAGRIFVESCFTRDRRAEGVQALNDLIQLAKATGEREIQADLLWQRYVGVRPMFLGDPARARPVFDLALAFVQTLNPSPYRANLEHGLARDLSLGSWDEYREGQSMSDLAGVSDQLERQLRSDEDAGMRWLGLEVLLRCKITLGRFDETVKLLEEIAATEGGELPLNHAKLTVTRARFFAATGQLEQGWQESVRALDVCEQGGFAHYLWEARRVQSELARLEVDRSYSPKV